MWAVVPIKKLDIAKQRLAPAMPPEDRIALCKAMLADVLETLTHSPGIDGVTVVCADDEVAKLVKRFGCEVLQESQLDAKGLSAVVAASIRQLAALGIDNVLVVHGDLPMLSQSDLSMLLSTHVHAGGMSVTIAADSRRSGSNCIAASPAHCLSYHYGEKSLSKHLHAARDAGMKSTVLLLPGASFDIDTPEDLSTLQRKLDADDCSHTSRCLERLATAEDRNTTTNGLPFGYSSTAVLGRSE